MAARPERCHELQNDTQRVASGRPERAGHVTFADAGPQLVEMGYEPLPIRPGQKRPAPRRWSKVEIGADQVASWAHTFSDHGVGLRTGRLVAIDIDERDPDVAHRLQILAEERLGETILRVGQWPKRLLLYRTDVPFAKMKVGCVEVLGRGQQFVAFGYHPGTGRPYYYPDGDTPLDVSLSDLPDVDASQVQAFLADVAALVGAEPRKPASGGSRSGEGRAPLRDVEGLVSDGRDSWLSSIAFHAVHDALDRGGTPDASALDHIVWSRFVETTNLDRPRKSGRRAYDPSDASKKVADKLRLAREGRLPARDTRAPAMPDYEAPTRTVNEGRALLSARLDAFASEVLDWHGDPGETAPPMLGIRATVGIGKSHASRDAVLRLQRDLAARGLAHRVMVFTPSHTLSDEVALNWASAGADVAVLRGYERTDPVTGTPMCRDLEMVRAAVSVRLPVQETACARWGGTTCSLYHECAKQQNRRDVAAAEVVIAPYDALFSGIAFDHDDIALLLVDEAVWPRATEVKARFDVEALPDLSLTGLGAVGGRRAGAGSTADLQALRARLADALTRNGKGPVDRKGLEDDGLNADACLWAARAERARRQPVALEPGLGSTERGKQFGAVGRNVECDQLADLWEALGTFLASCEETSGRLRVSDSAGKAVIELRALKRLHAGLRGKPVLHLDATLRPELGRCIFPGLEVENVEVAAPHTHVRQVIGRFGKSMICPGPGLSEEERARRSNRLRECVDYVRWQALRHRDGRVLVVTYKAIEQAFAEIPNVDVAHFNAIAGLDRYRDVQALIVIGRPLPSSEDLEAQAGALWGTSIGGRYEKTQAAVWMRSGAQGRVPVIQHSDEYGERLRAAICDDELIQAIGRGRGVNRSADTPLDVHVLADVALPLVYDELVPWELVKPDVMQQMLMAGVAVSSPADAARIHPDLFANENEAKLAFKRAAFKGQTPMNISYREMSLKSAAYRRPGRGHGWQSAWWAARAKNEVRGELEKNLGPLAEWRPVATDLEC